MLVDSFGWKRRPRRPGRRAEQILSLRGKLGVANSRLAYKRFHRHLIGSDRWQVLGAKGGATVQRMLWASTGHEVPGYWDDLLYVNNLIGPHTVNTLPENAYEAFRDHGIVERTVDRAPAGEPQGRS